MAGANGFIQGSRTYGYQPSLSAAAHTWSGYDSDGWFARSDVDLMDRDPRIRIGFRILCAPVRAASWKIRCDDPSAEQFIHSTIRRFWMNDLHKALGMLKYGALGGELLYCYDETRGGWCYDRLKDFRLDDVRPLDLRGEFSGVNVYSRNPAGHLSKNKIELAPPSSFWLANQPESGGYYGWPRYAGAWKPWKEKRGKHGAIDVRKNWMIRNSCRGAQMRYPDGSTLMPDGRYVPNQDVAREMVEKYMAGHVLALPGDFDKESGHFLWEWTEPHMGEDVSSILKYPEVLDTEILEGLEIWPEVLQAPEVGAGWSGRAIPFLMFLGSEDEIVTATLSAFVALAVRPLVRQRYGPSLWFEVEPESLLPKDAANPSNQQGLGGDQGMTQVPSGVAQPAAAEQALGGPGVQMSHDGSHRFSSTQINLPLPVAVKCFGMASRIPPEDLDSCGREQRPHVTVRYGLHTGDPAKVQRVLSGFGPASFTLGQTSVFPARESGGADVVKIDVAGNDLHRLNRLLGELLEHTDTHEGYKPHVTLAYVKPGRGGRYAGWKDLAGKSLAATEIAFCDHDGRQWLISLTGTSPELIPGGKAEGMSDRDFNPFDLDEGERVEMEHTRDRRVAREIARDHLVEDPDYYKKLRAVEGDGKGGLESLVGRFESVLARIDTRLSGADPSAPGVDVMLSANDWIPETGPRGGHLWVNRKTGHRIYGTSNPGTAEAHQHTFQDYAETIGAHDSPEGLESARQFYRHANKAAVEGGGEKPLQALWRHYPGGRQIHELYLQKGKQGGKAAHRFVRRRSDTHDIVAHGPWGTAPEARQQAKEHFKDIHEESPPSEDRLLRESQLAANGMDAAALREMSDRDLDQNYLIRFGSRETRRDIPAPAPETGDKKSDEPKGTSSGVDISHPDLQRIVRKASGSTPLGQRVHSASDADVRFIDAIYNHPEAKQHLDTHTNEYMRRADVAWEEWERGLKSGGDLKRLQDRLHDTKERITKKLIPGLRKIEASGIKVPDIIGGGDIPSSQVASFYERHAVPLLDEMYASASGHSLSFSGADRSAPELRLGAEDWVQMPQGPRGGHQWQNRNTGEIRRQKDNPGAGSSGLSKTAPGGPPPVKVKVEARAPSTPDVHVAGTTPKSPGEKTFGAAELPEVPGHKVSPSGHSTTNPTYHLESPEGNRLFAKRPQDRKGNHQPAQVATEIAANRIQLLAGVPNVGRVDRIHSPSGDMVASPLLEGVHGIQGEFTPERLAKLRQANSKRDLVKMHTGDWLLNAEDRHSGNYLVNREGKILPIDYGVSFHPHNDTFGIVPRHSVLTHTHEYANLPSEKPLVEKSDPLDKLQLQRIVQLRPQIESNLKELAPHYGDDAPEMLKSLRARLDHAEELAKMPNPTVKDLEGHKGGDPWTYLYARRVR